MTLNSNNIIKNLFYKNVRLVMEIVQSVVYFRTMINRALLPNLIALFEKN